MSKTRQKIVDAARLLFYTRGFDNTSLGAISIEAGVPKGNFYYHFQTKDDVLRAVIAARHKHIEAALSAWAKDYPTPLTRLQRFVEMLTHERSNLVRYGCPAGSLVSELGKKRDDLRSEAVAILDLYINFVAAGFREFGHPKDAARTLAIRLVARAQGAILLAQAFNDPALLDREIVDIQTWIEEQTETRPVS